MPLARVRLVPAGADRLYGNVATMVTGLPYFHPRETEPGQETTPARAGQWVVAKIARELGINVTGGSSSVVDGWDVLRLAAATARARLLGAASIAWKQPAGELVVRDGVVSHGSGNSAHYGELARMAAATPTGEVRLKRREDWRLIGTAAPRIDAVAKSDGSARFGSDVRPPGLLFAAIRHCPMLGGSPGAVDIAPALALAGVERVVRLGPYGGSTAALAVVGRTGWHAQRGADAIKVEWQQRPAGGLDTRDVMAHLEESARAAATRRRRLRVPQPRRHRQRRRRRGAPYRADLPRALSRARDDGADQLHGARRRRQGRGVGADAGAGPGANDGRRSRRRRRRRRHRPRHLPRRRLRPPARRRLRRPGGAHRRRDRRPTGAAGVVARRGPDARLLSPGRGRDPARRPRRRRLADHAAGDERRRRDHAALDRARRPVRSPARSTRPTRRRAKACSTSSTPCRTSASPTSRP